MLNFFQLTETDKLGAYRVVADDMQVNEAIIEKDFWVCLMLEILFEHSKYSNRFAFKGGTSLSKAYQIIQRFSEDIDLILDWRVLGYDTNEPWCERSKTAQRKFNDQANERAAQWIQNKLIPDLNDKLMDLGISEVKLKISDRDVQTIQVFYPKAFDNQAILQEIRLEIGPLAAWTPIQNKDIQSYVAQALPHLF
ncbi:MAG: Nucleotidyl transferase AbiEii/AbiGii toxin family protein [Lactococcus sp.]|jgi:predicted nucleotidyltransferase component of viral defense system